MQRSFAPSVLASLALAGTASANILLNPGFELGAGGDADSWAEINGGPNGSITRSNAMPNSGDYSAYIEFDNTGNPAGGAYFIEQNLGANTIDNGLNYDLSFFAKVDSTSFVGHDIFFQLQWLDQDGSDGGGFKGQLDGNLGVLGVNTSYQQFTFTDIDVPDGADSFLLRFQVSAGAVPDVANGLYVDDASLTVVPEPGSLALLGLGALAMVRRRRG